MRDAIESHGIALDRWSSIMLCYFASMEGLTDISKTHWKNLHSELIESYDSSVLQEIKRVLLSSALIHGGFHLLMRPFTEQYIDLQRIHSEGIPIQADFPYSASELSRLSKIFQKKQYRSRN